jgi:hypothetical protein
MILPGAAPHIDKTAQNRNRAGFGGSKGGVQGAKGGAYNESQGRDGGWHAYRSS